MKPPVHESEGKGESHIFQDLSLHTTHMWGISNKKTLCFCQLTIDIQQPVLQSTLQEQ